MVLGPGEVAGWTVLSLLVFSTITLIFVYLTGGAPTQKIPRTRIVDVSEGRCRVIVPRRERKTKSWRHATHKKGEVKVVEAGRGKPVEHFFDENNFIEFSDDETGRILIIHGKNEVEKMFSRDTRILRAELDSLKTQLAKVKAYNSTLEKNLDEQVLKRIKDSGAVLDNVPFIKTSNSHK